MSLLESTVPLTLLENEEKPSNNDCKRRIASAAILCVIATWSFSNEDNHAAEIEAWTVYIAYVLALAERWALPFKIYKDSFEIAQESIYNSFAKLCEEIKERGYFSAGNPLTDSYIYGVRVSWLLAVDEYFRTLETQ